MYNSLQSPVRLECFTNVIIRLFDVHTLAIVSTTHATLVKLLG